MRMSRRWLTLLAMPLLLGLVAAACSDVSDDEGGATTGAASGSTEVPDNSDTTITLAVNAWVGAAANAARRESAPRGQARL